MSVMTTAAPITLHATTCTQTWVSGGRLENVALSFTMNSRIAAICSTVLILPYHEAAITVPSAEATMRSPETMNSRAMMTSAIHAGNTCISMSASNAAVTRSLSASGSRNLPNVVTSLRDRAR